ncbi:MAG: NAD(P)H-dependent flavin oxidoreductase [Anaerovoracaceae bacterium]|jgi:nitronate monooxygenase
MKIPELNIGGLIAKVPIIQGGMGIGVSGSQLAAAVACEGGIGIIASVNIGYREPDFYKDTHSANIRALKAEIRKVRELAPKGIIGVNIMVATSHYGETVRAAVEEGIDLIISGAGLPLELPEYVKGSETRIVPIVSSAKAAKSILRYWERHYNRQADAVIVEGTEAGGHLGFSPEILKSENKPSLIDMIKELVNHIPIIGAGGIYTGEDIAECLKAGASGVQMATRFVATEECDADIKFKEAYIAAGEDDLVIIVSPVGMPGRALNNNFVKRIALQGDEIKSCLRCLKDCNPKTAPYCISTALINGVRGNVDQGLIFAGSNVHRVDKIVSVKALMDELKEGIIRA